jgi:hypothetical protein
MMTVDGNHDSIVSRRQAVIGLACGGAVVGIGGSMLLRRFVPYFAFDRQVQAARSRARPHIEKAAADSLASVDPSLRTLQAFFDDAKGHTKAFAEDVLGWYSKYKLIRGQHEEFLTATFRKHFFGPDELRGAMVSAVEAYIADLDAIDNQMLVDIRMDVADLPTGAALMAMPVPDVQDRYRTLCGRIAGITGADAAVNVGRVAAETIVTSVVVMMAARMGTSAVVLGTAAASSYLTFGISVVIGWIVDQIISAVWNWTYDPHGKLVAMMESKIDEVRNLVLDGEGGQPGVREALRQYADKRAVVRREAVLQLLADTKGRA